VGDPGALQAHCRAVQPSSLILVHRASCLAGMSIAAGGQCTHGAPTVLAGASYPATMAGLRARIYEK